MERFPLHETTWESGLSPADYFARLANYRNLVLSLYSEAAVADEDREAVAAALATLTGDAPAPQRAAAAPPPPDAAAATEEATEAAASDRLRLLVLTEDWCGDSATTLPYIARLAEALDLPSRVFRQSANPAIKAWYVERETEHIPVVSLLQRTGTDGWQEVMRWVERPAAARVRVEAWLAAQPRFEELSARKEADPAAAKEYFSLYARLLRTMAGWYRDGLWSEIAGEFAEKIGKIAGTK